MKLPVPFTLFVLFSVFPLPVRAMQGDPDPYIFSQIDHRQGMSNSAVICIFKDDSELMWFGTYDGVNCYDGSEMEIYRADFSRSTTLDNNVIYGICNADGNNLWISTLLGLNRFSRDERQVVANYNVPPGSYLCSNSSGNTWLVGQDSISYYNTCHQEFCCVEMNFLDIRSTSQRSFVTDDGTLWLFPEGGDACDVYKLSLDGFDRDHYSVKIGLTSSRFHHKPIENIFYQDNVSFCFVDSDKDLYMYDIGRQAKVRVHNLNSLMRKYGRITGIVPFYDDFIIAFHTNGLIRLNTAESYREEVIDRNLRVFDLYKDPVQGILWIGADGQGAMMYSRRHSIATNLVTGSLSPNFTRQVRSVMTDRFGGLWFGTKGDGLIHIEDYAAGMTPEKTTVFFPERSQPAPAYTRGDAEFPVFELKPGNYIDGFWVGSGAYGLFYYLFEDGTLRHLEDPSGDFPNEVHDLHEPNDSTLYVATANSGFRRLTLERAGNRISIRSQKQYRFFHAQQEIRTFFAMVPENDTILWLGSRERGLVRFNTVTEEYRVVSLTERIGRNVDDVLCICRTADGDMFVGTTAGLIRLEFDGKRIEAQYTGREQGLPNDMIHGILEDRNGFLWLSTNKGLIKYNPANGSSHTYYYSGGVHIGEFSDDAFYKCPYTERLFFGGIDGLLYIDQHGPVGFDYYPEILIRKFSIAGAEVNLSDYMVGQGLQFKFGADGFAFKFAAPDFISGADIEYSWMLEGYDADWHPFGMLREASYRGVPAGNYICRVRYRKDIFDTEFKHFEIPVRIVPLWYQTTWAILLFTFLAVGTVGYIGFLVYRYVENRRLVARLTESESRSLSGSGTAGMNHQFIDVLVSIYQACDYLQAEDTTPTERNEKVARIRENVMSLFLPTGIFRGAGAGKFFPVTFSVANHINVREITDEVMALLAERNFKVDNIELDIPVELRFPVYRNAFRYFFYYVFLFACELRPVPGFAVAVSQDDGMLTVNFRSAKGLLRKLHDSLTDEGYLLPVATRDPDAAFGMQLLHRYVRAMVDQLKPVVSFSDTGGGTRLGFSFRPAIIEQQATDRKSLLLLEDNDEMYWLVSELLSAEYTVHQVRSVQQALEFIRNTPPVVFLVDMMMYADAEDKFMEFINRNGSLLTRTAFIPMLTWRTSLDMRRQLVMLADSDIVLPYDIMFLKEIVHKAIYGRREIKPIHIDGLGDFAGLITCSSDDQAEFIRRVLAVIERNIDREDLGSSFIADQMAMSPRQFYRRFKEISGLPPTELIKNYRMEKAAVLLRDPALSIQDIIADVGIASRSYFYKEFTRRFGMTPKNYRDQHCGGPAAP
ncbi:MAG: helix-turn-helix domain-containing protein [Alistipes sp.]|nr:helix-turn-helix domain-containing protein [Alistipes sp.]